MTPVAGAYLLSATLHDKARAGSSARMCGRLVLKGTTEIRGSSGEIGGAHVSGAAALWFQTMVALTAGDTVEPGVVPWGGGYVAADHLPGLQGRLSGSSSPAPDVVP